MSLPLPMTRPHPVAGILVLTSGLLAGLVAESAQPSIHPADALDFDRVIRPMLANACFTCHGPDAEQRQADLRLDLEDQAKASALIPGDPAASELVRRIQSTDPDQQMPPPDQPQRLTARQIDQLVQWVRAGAPWSEHWSLVPPEQPDLPAVRQADWPRTPIDFFVLDQLEQRARSPAPVAAPQQLLRRVTLDLTGLPPTVEELDAFLADTSEAAYERVVDRLLASPRYGEHLAADWLAAARYADTNGYQTDATRTMWPWRDWVVRALNANLPFDQFTIDQLAGDLVDHPTTDQLIATGLHRNHALNGEGGRLAEESRVEYVVDRAATTGTIWLGLTVGCARCHDHKYDPISQRDFYRLYAFFNNIDETGGVDAQGNAKPVMALTLDEHGPQPAPPPNAQPEPETNAEQPSAPVVEVMVMRERSAPREAFVLQRGQWDQPDKTQPVTAGVPQSLPPLPDGLPVNRLALARWLVSDNHPLTSRVAVNRAWQHFFGIGLVKTSEDFGTQGERPSHPELLDWLASWYVDNGWDTKALHKLIVMSATYQQASGASAELIAMDPENRWLARGPRFRLSSQALRDQALAISGLLVEKIGGPAVHPYQPEGVWEAFSLGKIRYTQGHGDELYRRSLYTFWRRPVGPTMFFDVADRQVCTVRQSRTNTPLHALTLLNDTTYVEAARVLAQRLLADPDPSPRRRLRHAFRMATARRPREQELNSLIAALDFLRVEFAADPDAANQLIRTGEAPLPTEIDVAELAAYTGVMNVILNLDEVITRG